MPLSITDHETRAGRITASTLAAIAGLHPYRTPLDAYLTITGEVQTETNLAMRVGTYAEQGIAEAYAEHADCELAESPTLVHPEIDWLAATPDRIATSRRDPSLRWDVEIKMPQTGASLRRWGPDGSQDYPVEVVCQAHAQMAVTGLQYADVVAAVYGELRVYPTPWDQNLWDMLLDAAARFRRDHLVPRKPPAMDGSKSACEYVKRRYPTDDAGPLETTPEIDDLATQLQRARAAAKVAAAEQARLENEIKMRLGAHGYVVGDWGQISWRAAKPTAKIDWEAIAKAAGATDDLIDEHTVLRPGARRFLPRFIDS